MALFDSVFYVNAGNGTSTGYYAVTPWAATTAVAAGVFRRQLATPTVGNERCFVCTVAGTTGGSEPSWVLTRGGLTTDGSVTWQECTGMAGTNESTQTNAPTWTTVKNLAVSLSEVIYDSGSASLQICSTAGTAGNGSTPSFSATAGVTTTDNTITWTSLGLASGFSGWQYPHARIANALAIGWAAPIANSKVYVSGNSAETQASALTLSTQGTPALPVVVLCVNSSAAPPTALATTSTVTCSSGNLNVAASAVGGGTGNSDNAYYNGFKFITTGSGGSIFNESNGNNNLTLDNTVMQLNNSGFATITIGGGQNSGAIIKHNGTSFLFGNASQTIECQGGWILMQACTFAASGTVPTNLITQVSNIPLVNIVMRDCDLSNINTNLVKPTVESPPRAECTTHILLQNCKLNASMTPVNGSIEMNPGVALRMMNCDSGNTNYKFYAQSYLGIIQQETTVVRTGGASSNGTGLSVNMTSNANTGFTQPLITYPPFGDEIAVFNPFTSGTHTCTVFLTSNTALDNSLFWADLEYLGTAGFPLGVIVSSKMAWFGTPTTLTSDSSTWGGSITHKYKIVLSYTPTEVGWMKVRLALAAVSATVYVDFLPVLA